MACEIEFKDRAVQLNNKQFSRLINFAIEIADAVRDPSTVRYVDHLTYLQAKVFFPGRGIEVEEDFPDIEERKFWAGILLDTSRAIFDRRIGVHDHSFWQAQAIHQAHATGLLFQHSVRESEPRWSADSIDRREFDQVVNGIER